MTDSRFTLPESFALLNRAGDIAERRHSDLGGAPVGPGSWHWLQPGERNRRALAVLNELRDLTIAASYDAAIRWLGELLGEPRFAGLWLSRSPDGAWFLCHEDGLRLHLAAVPATIPDHRHALALALAAALEARRV